MRFKQRTEPPIPSVNLIPMLNAMLAILAFFVVIAVAFSREATIEAGVPQPREELRLTLPDPLVVTLTSEEAIFLEDQLLTREDMLVEVLLYLDENPNGSVLLKPSPGLTYQPVITLLSVMQEVGGARVSLAPLKLDTEE